MYIKTIKKVLKWTAIFIFVVIVSLAILTGTLLIIGHRTDRSMQAISASTYAFQDFSDTRMISLGLLQEHQILVYELVVEKGNVELWVENSAGERYTAIKGARGMEFEVLEDGEYSLVISGSEATFHMSSSILEKRLYQD